MRPDRWRGVARIWGPTPEVQARRRASGFFWRPQLQAASRAAVGLSRPWHPRAYTCALHPPTQPAPLPRTGRPRRGAAGAPVRACALWAALRLLGPHRVALTAQVSARRLRRVSSRAVKRAAAVGWSAVRPPTARSHAHTRSRPRPPTRAAPPNAPARPHRPSVLPAQRRGPGASVLVIRPVRALPVPHLCRPLSLPLHPQSLPCSSASSLPPLGY